MESTELQSACVSLGYREKNGYALEPDCLATVKLLIRFLRNEPDGHSVRYQLGYARIVQNDLIPILQYHSSDRELADAVLRLLLNLSQPTLVCFNGRLPNDKPTRKIFIELDQYLVGYKQSFANIDFLKVITASLAKLVKVERDGKLPEEDRLVLERYLLLIRNILHVDDARFKDSGLAGEDLSGPGAHDDLLMAISKSGLDLIILYLATSAEEHGYALHVLEILWLLFRDITPSVLIAATKNEASGGLKLNAEDLSEISRQSYGSSTRLNGSYRAELKGTFAVKNKWLNPSKADNLLGENKNTPSSMVIHKHKGSDDAASTLDVIGEKKKKIKKSSLRDIAMQDTLEKDRGDAITVVRPALRDFLTSFAKRLLIDASGYNNLMSAADRVISHAPADSHDESFYLWAISFFMELARGLVTEDDKFPISKAVECIGQTLGLEALTFVHTHMTTYADGLETDRFDKVMWNKRLVLAVRAFGEQIAWADALARSKNDPSSAEMGRTLVFNIVYEAQFRDVLPQLLKKYKESRHCKAFLRGLVAATHTHLKLMDFLHQSGCDKVVVAQRSKRKSKKQSKTSKKGKKEQQNRIKAPWSDVLPGLKEAFDLANADVSEEGFMADDPIVRGAIDPALSAIDIDDVVKNQSTASRIGQLLLKHEPKYAVAALRLARKLFPEHAEKYFGGLESNHLTVQSDENYFEFLYETSEFIDDDSDVETNKENKYYDENGSEEEEEEEYDDERKPTGRETNMNVMDIAINYCHVAIIQPYVMLFEKWSTNPVDTNHHIARFFKRVAIDWKIPTMLYQLRVFMTCRNLLNKAEQAAVAKIPIIAQELVSFSKFIVNGFLKLAATVGKVAFVELLFWKNRPDALAFASNYENLFVPAAGADEVDAEIEAKRKSNKSKGKSKVDEANDAAFDRLVKQQENAVRKFDDSDDDIDDEGWSKIVDKKEKSGDVGETSEKPKKKRAPRKPRNAKDDDKDSSKVKKGKKRNAESIEHNEVNNDEKSSSSTSSSSNSEVAENFVKRAKMLTDNTSDDEDDSPTEKTLLPENKHEQNRKTVPKITYGKSAPPTINPKNATDDNKESDSSMLSIELEIVDENDDAGQKKYDLDDDLMKDARLHLSDSSADEDEESLVIKKRKPNISRNPKENDVNISEDEGGAGLSGKKKHSRRKVLSDDDD